MIFLTIMAPKSLLHIDHPLLALSIMSIAQMHTTVFAMADAAMGLHNLELYYNYFIVK